jgi:hypothetical protein
MALSGQLEPRPCMGCCGNRSAPGACAVVHAEHWHWWVHAAVLLVAENCCFRWLFYHNLSHQQHVQCPPYSLLPLLTVGFD